MVLPQYTVGADPEVFLLDQERNLVSAIGLIGGDKLHPRIMTKEGIALQEDNVMAEFNIPPSKTFEDFNSNIIEALRILEQVVFPNTALISATTRWPANLLSDEKAKEFGCDPFHVAYNDNLYEPVIIQEEFETGYRHGAGHVHVGLEAISKSDELFKRAFIVLLDKHLGTGSVVLSEKTSRCESYGQAGCFRNKSYGVEYRTLSNFWLREPDLRKWVWNQIATAIQEFINIDSIYAARNVIAFADSYRDIINTHNKSKAYAFIKDNQIALV